jgi:putative transposase
MIEQLVSADGIDVRGACAALQIARASFYRLRNGKEKERVGAAGERGGGDSTGAAASARALSVPERQEVLQTLNSPRFENRAPAQVYATLLDEGVYLCSERTMYRLLGAHGQVRERRDQLCHPAYRKPELLARGPNQVWSWDITKLRGPAKWVYYYLYVILDVFSRYAVGWMVALAEQARLAEELIRETCGKQGIAPGQLTVHADRGASMRSKTVTMLLSDLGILQSHSRPHTSDDNPFSEAQFKTLKYWPGFPDRFGSLQDARAFCREFFRWYNQEHRHSGIGLMTPETVHYGRTESVRQARQNVLLAAFHRHPERFVRKQPVPPLVPSEVWINPPVQPSGSEEVLQ